MGMALAAVTPDWVFYLVLGILAVWGFIHPREFVEAFRKAFWK